ncbi:hypothetical protein BHE74_00028258 [Ensete ventricosum]|nr:hypothetical protein BHE74_00028258 [Ensete ventricosum]
MASRLWRMYADRQFYKWEKTVLWDMIEPYRRPKSFTPLISIYVAAFYTGVIGSAITEQLYKVFFFSWDLIFSSVKESSSTNFSPFAFVLSSAFFFLSLLCPLILYRQGMSSVCFLDLLMITV